MNLQRAAHGETRGCGLRGAEPERIDVALVDACGGIGALGCVDDQVVERLVPVLGEGCAAHADDRDLVLDAMRTHYRTPLTGATFQK